MKPAIRKSPTEPYNLSSSVCHGTVLRFGTGTSNCLLLFAFPFVLRVSKKKTDVVEHLSEGSPAQSASVVARNSSEDDDEKNEGSRKVFNIYIYYIRIEELQGEAMKG